ncbi:kynureninase [Flavobacteriales bacterium]|nr:kynureninase [Flavobacteriales bacterium]
MEYENTIEFAKRADSNDILKNYRDRFHFPKIGNNECLYFTGNSLGLQPKTTKEYINRELDDWAEFGVEGHFDARRPWFSYHELLTNKTARLVGAKPEEVVVTHSLTTNLHLLMVSFYRPNADRFKIICEAKAFPSDQYALESQVRFHGFDPEETIVEVSPRDGEHIIRDEDVIAKINECGDELALVMIGGVNYYTGQVFDMKRITHAGHEVGAVVGWDLAHGAGNLILNLHDWEVDFAAWCGYKYLNSSPGGVSGIFINERHVKNKDLVRFAGWWGHDKETRFLMEKGFNPMVSAEAWQLSNAPVLGMAAHLASLDMFDEVGMDALRAKTIRLSGYLEYVINTISKNLDVNLEIITPTDWNQRGCQVSIIAHGYGKQLFEKLSKAGIIVDWREPNVIRMAPVPLYNSFEDVYKFGEVLKSAL